MEQMDKNREQDRRIDIAEHDISAINQKLDRLLTYIDSDKNTGRKGLFELIEVLQDDLTKLRLEHNQRILVLEELEKIKLAKRTAAKAFWLGLGGFLTFIITQADELARWIKHLFKVYP